jgi:photosystem II stability/assembly factor-like uncharacterized protein
MKFFRATILVVLLLATAFPASAQSWQNAIGPTENNFLVIKAKADAHFDSKGQTDPTLYRAIPSAEGARNFDKDYIKYQRWVWFWESRVMADGSFPDLTENFQAYKRLQNSNAEKNLGPQWENITQTSSTSGYNGMGRTTCMAFHPTDANTFYIGAPRGGIWKTTDGGNTYAALGNDLPYSAVGSIIVDHQDPNTLYIATGENRGWWEYSLGVMKSVDGGISWNQTGLSYSFTNGVHLAEVVMSPANNNVLLAATSSGIRRSDDGGDTWINTQAGDFSDLQYHPTDTDIVYAALNDYWGSSEVFTSIDGGQSWTQTSNFGLPTTQIRLAVTAADPDKVLAMFTDGNELYTSNDAGQSFSYTGQVPASDGIIISQTNANRVWVGQLDVYESNNGGSSFNQISIWYGGQALPAVHADTRNTAHNPLVPSKMWFCNDGGIYSFNENNNTFTDHSDGLIIMQYYSLACAQSDSEFLIGGTQDNGGRQRISGTTWSSTNGGDAMVTAIDPTDKDVFYTTYINGQLYRTTDGWNNDTYNDISANIPGGQPNGKWVTPYVIDPNSNTTLVAAYDDIYRSTDRGDSWTQLSTNLAGGEVFQTVAVAPSNSDVIYASWENTVYATIDLGTTWSSLNPPVSNSQAITSIDVHPTDANTFWITLDSYVASKKVYQTNDGGQTWNNWTGSLPNVPVNTIIYENGSNDALYIGTDIGVFYRNASMSDWTWWSVGMPNTVVTDIDIQYSAGIIRASTYGRGIFERDLCDDALDTDLDGITDCQDLCPEDPDKIEPGDCGCGIPDTEPCFSVGQSDLDAEVEVSLYPNPSNGQFTLEIDAKGEELTLEVLNLQGQLVHTQSELPKGTNSIDLTHLAKGLYWVKIYGNETQIVRECVLVE